MRSSPPGSSRPRRSEVDGRAPSRLSGLFAAPSGHATRGSILQPFTPDAALQLPGPDWLTAVRREAAERFVANGLPTSEEEVWRYSRIDELELDRYRAEIAATGDDDGVLFIDLRHKEPAPDAPSTS